MTPETLAALKGSIAKWENILKGTGEDTGTDNCPLCEMFFGEGEELSNRCVSCPVLERTGLDGCLGSPYEDWSDHHANHHHKARLPYRIFPNCVECRTLAQAELDFLTSLLPETERN